jgi:hypothetical protein
MKIIFTFAAFFLLTTCWAQSAWPSGTWQSATNLTAVMAIDGINDLSGLHWNPVTNRLYCVQGDGRLRVLQLNTVSNVFTQFANRAVPDGPEGITQVNFAANEFYTIDENNYEIRKFTHNAAFGSMTEARHWNLLASPSPMEDTGNTGPEGIAFVPDSFLSAAGFISQTTGMAYTSVKGMGGLMFVAHQDGGFVWVFDVNPNVNNDFAFVGKYHTNRSESCDLSFDRTTGMLYILHNAADGNTLETTDLSSFAYGAGRKFTMTNEYYLAATGDANVNVEGFALSPKCPAGNSVNVWLCRDVETSENNAVLQDALRWFTPFAADGNCIPLGLDEHSAENGLAVYPDPKNHLVTVKLAGEIQNGQIQIIDSLGQVVKSQSQCTGSDFTFDTSSLSAGLYVFEVSACDFIARIKWIKN